MAEKKNINQALAFLGPRFFRPDVSDQSSQTNETLPDEAGILKHEKWALGTDAHIEVLYFQSHAGLSQFYSKLGNSGAGEKVHKIMEVADADGSKRLYRLLVTA